MFCMENIKTYFEIESGSVPYRIQNNNIEYLIIYREKFNDYTFPKGHVEHRESLEDCAARETNEEAGVIGDLEDYVDVFEYKVIEKKKGGSEYCMIRRVYNYLFKVVNENRDFVNPDKVEGLTSLVWLSYEEALEKLTYQNNKEVLTKAKNIILNKELN